MTNFDGPEILERLRQRMITQLELTPVMATEIEFYLHGNGDIQTFEQALNEAVAEAGLRTGPLEQERGPQQYEVHLKHSPDVKKVAGDTVTLTDIIRKQARRAGFEADFHPKPFAGEYGSGMHIHLSLLDKEGRNIFTRGEDDVYSPPLIHAIGGMQALLPESMIFFAPNEDSYGRFVAKMNAPLTISWGANNRTVAIRLPDGPADGKHIEHRVPGSDCDPYLAMAAVLAGALFGITRKAIPGEKIYGDAALPQYALPALPKSFAAAKKLYRHSGVVKGYFEG